MKKGRKVDRFTRRLGIEGLERRELLAGNVSVSLSSGNLRITGNGAENHITIFQQANGRFNIAGLDGEVFSGPTTNLTVRNITVNLGGGDDSVVIAAQPNPQFPGELLPASVIGTTTVNGGAGSDTIAVSVVGRVAGTFLIPAVSISIDGGNDLSGAQDDIVALVNSSAGLVSVRTWAGDDTVDLVNVLALNTTVDAGTFATFNGTTDNDVVTLFAVTALNATVSLGAGNNTAGNLLQIDTGLFGTLNVSGGSGLDAVTLANTLAGQSLTVNTFGGADFVNLDVVQTGLTQADYQDLADLVIDAFGINVNALPFNLQALITRLPNLPGFMTISTGEGADVVTANDLFSTFAIYIFLDGGNDQLLATSVESQYAWFFGGLGSNARLLTDIDAYLLDLQFTPGLIPSSI